MATAQLLSVEGVSKSFPGVQALKDVHLDLNSGEVLALVGENGAGKSTLMKVLSGIYKRDTGVIKLNNQPIEVDGPLQAQKLGIAIIHQEMNLMPHLTVAQNILIGREPRKLFGIATDDKELNRQAKILLDELHLNLDPNQLVEIRELIKKIGEEKTVILSTHIMQEVEAICDRIVIISKGKIVANDKASILQNETTHQTVYVEFDSKVSKSQLIKIPNIQKVEAVNNAWLIETSADIDLRKEISQFAQKEKWLILTLKIEKKSLEEVFKDLTK